MNKAFLEEDQFSTVQGEEWGPVFEHELELPAKQAKTVVKNKKKIQVIDVAGKNRNTTRTAAEKPKRNRGMPLSSLLSRVLKLDVRSLSLPSFLRHPSFDVKMDDDDLPEGVIIDSFVAEVEYKKVSVVKLQA